MPHSRGITATATHSRAQMWTASRQPAVRLRNIVFNLCLNGRVRFIYIYTGCAVKIYPSKKLFY